MTEESGSILPSLDKILEDENKIVIIFLIYIFGALNLKILAKLIGKSEPPVLRWIKKMLEEDLLVIDQPSTKRSRGKFYKLSPKSVKFFAMERFPPTFEQDPDATTKENINNQGVRLIRSMGLLDDITSKISVSMYENINTNPEYANRYEKGEFTALSSFSMIHFKSIDEVQKFRGMLEDFSTKVEQEFDVIGVNEPVKYSHCMTYNVTPIYIIKQMIEDMKKDW